MSTLSQPNLTPAWKQEVNRRIAAHKNRKGSASTPDAPSQADQAAPSRAAQAAARVAARYAKAPTYSDMQAAETRVAVRAAEIATKVALEAQAVAETALAEMHAASAEPTSRGPAVVETFASPARKKEVEASPIPEQGAVAARAEVQRRAEDHESLRTTVTEKPALVFPQESRVEQSYGIRWDPDMPVRPAERKPQPARPQEEFELSAEDWWSPAEVIANPRGNIDLEPAHANLIQFPRELVATRKMRPRLAEMAVGTISEAEGQLSIFEVDPGSVSTEVDTLAVEQAPAASMASYGPEWSGIKLSAQPVQERAAAPDAQSARCTHLAPLGLRLMATVVDSALMIALFGVVGFVVAANVQHPPAGKAAEAMGIAALVLVGLLYHAAFFSMAVSTPGMKYAGIALCTFDDESPTRAQLRRRLGAMVLSVLPLGLGLVWSVFDEDHLSWHDRFSQTYLRKR